MPKELAMLRARIKELREKLDELTAAAARIEHDVQRHHADQDKGGEHPAKTRDENAED